MPRGEVDGTCSTSPRVRPDSSSTERAWPTCCPRRLGTAVASGPEEMTRSTGVPPGASVPAGGSVPRTAPRGTSTLGRVVEVPITRPTSSRRRPASSTVSPKVRGTTTAAPPVVPARSVSSGRSPVPRSAATTRPSARRAAATSRPRLLPTAVRSRPARPRRRSPPPNPARRVAAVDPSGVAGASTRAPTAPATPSVAAAPAAPFAPTAPAAPAAPAAVVRTPTPSSSSSSGSTSGSSPVPTRSVGTSVSPPVRCGSWGATAVAIPCAPAAQAAGASISPSTCSRSRRISAADCGRAHGSFSSARTTMSSSAASRPGRRDDGAGGRVRRWWRITSLGEPRNGG